MHRADVSATVGRMVYHDPFRRLVFSGTLYGTEGWSMGLTMGHEGLGDGTNPSSVDEAIVTAATAFFSSWAVAAPVHLTTIKYNLIGVNGRYYEPTASTRYDYAEPIVGGATSALPIPQATVCVSLMTSNSRGPAHAGRFFMPGPGVSCTTDGRLTVANATNFASLATDFLNDLNAVDTSYLAAVVSNVGIGAQNLIDHVRVGRVIDTMRSRRTSLVEDYQVGAQLA